MFADPPGCSYSVFLLVVVISWNTCAVKRGSQLRWLSDEHKRQCSELTPTFGGSCVRRGRSLALGTAVHPSLASRMSRSSCCRFVNLCWQDCVHICARVLVSVLGRERSFNFFFPIVVFLLLANPVERRITLFESSLFS